MKKYIKLYKQKSDENLKEWKYRYPPLDQTAFEEDNRRVYREHLQKNEWRNEMIKTKLYVSLLDATKEFGFFVAFQSRDFKMLNDVLYQTSRQNLLNQCMTASGGCCARILWDAPRSFACNDFEVIDCLFPRENPLFSDDSAYLDVSANLLRVLYYNEFEQQSAAVGKANSFLEKKHTLWAKYVVLYFLALVNRDAEQANNCLQELCKAHQKKGKFYASELEKCFASEIHGFYRLARIIDGDFFSKLKYPKHDSFFCEFEEWHKEQNYPKGQLFYVYPPEMDYINRIFEAQMPKITLKETKTGGRIRIFPDEEKFAADLTENTKRVCSSGKQRREE
ncbi:MAG: hypothetical protein LBH04_07555 [Tannerellaceae bacterium]|nr:hypothetical protein [Tannerellaceae bacterium]